MAKTDPRPKTKKGLTIKQDRFVREYVKHGNGTAAARSAGYAVPRQQSVENLAKPVIAKEVLLLRARMAERLDISREKLMNDAAHDAEQAALTGQYSASNANRLFIAKVQGYIVDRTESHHTVDATIAHLDALKTIMGNHRAAHTPVVVTDVSDDDADGA
jgi:hypothetical protein